MGWAPISFGCFHRIETPDTSVDAMPRRLKMLENDRHCSSHPKSTKTNPFDSDSESEVSPRPARTPERDIFKPTAECSSCRKSGEKGGPSSAPPLGMKQRSKYESLRRFGNWNAQQQENYVIHKAEGTTEALRNCLKIVEDIKEDAADSLVKLHHQGEQIIKAHLSAIDIERDLSRGEKLLGSLGGIFSKSWKPKIAQPVKGPVPISVDSLEQKRSHVDQEEWFSLSFTQSKENSNIKQGKVTSAQEKVKMEKFKQDDMLTELSNSLNLLKDMASEMTFEIDRQNKALDGLRGDVDILNTRMMGANARGRRLLGK